MKKTKDTLTEDQKELLCALIDGYVYPRFLCQCDPSVDTEGVWDRTKEFLEIRQILVPKENFKLNCFCSISSKG